MSIGGTVFVVDDDLAVRDSLAHLLEAAGYQVETYANAEAFLTACDPDRPGCLVLDMQMSGMNGLALQAVLAERGFLQPTIFLTGYGTVSEAVRALKGGALDFLEKPVEGRMLIAHVKEALRVDAERRQAAAVRDALRTRCGQLTARERELLPLVVAGDSSKDIARRLGISHRTVEVHRASIMHKTGVQSVVELAAVAEVCGLAGKPDPEDLLSTPKTR